MTLLEMYPNNKIAGINTRGCRLMNIGNLVHTAVDQQGNLDRCRQEHRHVLTTQALSL